MVRGSNPGGGEVFRTCPNRLWGPPSVLYNGYRVFPGVKSGRGVTLTPHPLIVPWSRKSRAIPLFPLWAQRPVQSLSACTRVHFIWKVAVNRNTECQWIPLCRCSRALSEGGVMSVSDCNFSLSLHSFPPTKAIHQSRTLLFDTHS